ncbi:MAG: sigma-70 family RNA polymerase sigma factor [Oscillospiraceae bacterium]|nr:sigma-70 family RNA polymerase sigma factor [Oscillospiraceae bacterium]
MDAFEEIYRTYQQDVFRFVLRLSGYDAHTAEELTQETFYQAFLSFGKFRGECSMRTWLFQIAKHVYGKYVRKEMRQRGIAQLYEKSAEPPPGEQLERAELLEILRGMIEQLDEPARSVMQYRLYSETGYAEIARLLNIRANTAAVIYNRTVAKLRNMMKERYGYEI